MSQSINLYNQLANHKLFNKSVNFGLKRIKLALSLLGHPEKKLKNVISVIGESGKFTTLFSLKSFIEANNQKVTAHISPSIQDIKERFYMSKKYLTHNEIKKTIKKIEKLNIPLTIFECLTLVYIINASKINALYPTPGSWFQYKGSRLKIIKAVEIEKEGRPGEILDKKIYYRLFKKCNSNFSITKRGKKKV